MNVVSLVVDGKWAWELATLSCERVGYVANVDNVVLYTVINSNYYGILCSKLLWMRLIVNMKIRNGNPEWFCNEILEESHLKDE